MCTVTVALLSACAASLDEPEGAAGSAQGTSIVERAASRFCQAVKTFEIYQESLLKTADAYHPVGGGALWDVPGYIAAQTREEFCALKTWAERHLDLTGTTCSPRASHGGDSPTPYDRVSPSHTWDRDRGLGEQRPDISLFFAGEGPDRDWYIGATFAGGKVGLRSLRIQNGDLAYTCSAESNWAPTPIGS